MKVMLTRDVPKVGIDGEIVTVAGGFARNYLLPRRLALVANSSVMKQYQDKLAKLAALEANKATSARSAADRIEGVVLQFVVRANAHTGRLFGAVTEADVAAKLGEAAGVEVDRRKLGHFDAIKTTGAYSLSIRLHSEVTASFKVDVATQEQLEAREKARLAAELLPVVATEAASDPAVAAETPAMEDAPVDEAVPEPSVE
ncbi:MAG: 50S ribosomal protein L9 [Armatimonadetes bacterium]|nr:50S ribosomal protein L9 [Armatimonadota bacterium]MDE2205867.1 50S ribosomal protein L9 [Armatimonadota bacterium]